MNKEFIPYEQALELKELGFDQPCIAFYEPGNKEVQVVGVEQRYNDPKLLRMKDFCAPLYQQAFRWFREKGCLFEVSVNNKARVWDTYKTYDEAGLEDGDERVILYSKYFDTYEEAELACLKKLIEIVKNERK